MTEENSLYTCLVRNKSQKDFEFYSLVGFNSPYPYPSIPVLRQREDAERRFKNFLSLKGNLELIVVDITQIIRERLIHSDCLYFLEDDKLLREIGYVNEHLEELAERYQGFIAIHDGKVIDSDEDDFKLAARTEDLAREVGPILIENPGRAKKNRDTPPREKSDLEKEMGYDPNFPGELPFF